jgi:malonyl-CoA decarboxylase
MLTGLHALVNFLQQEGWERDENGLRIIKPVVMRLAAAYFLTAKRTNRNGTPTHFDSVAHFHLGNGAQVEELNWMGDCSAKGLKQSLGLMVNYRYKLDEVPSNHERYATECKVEASKHVYELYCAI